MKNLEIKDPYLQAMAASAAFATELAEVFKKYKTDMYSVGDVRLIDKNERLWKNSKTGGTGWWVDTTIHVSFCLEDFRLRNPLLSLSELHSDPASTELSDGHGKTCPDH